MQLDLLPQRLAVARFEPEAELPAKVEAARWLSVTRSENELSVVCPHEVLPEGIKAERGWRALRVQGPLPFELVGILAELSGCLAEAGVPIFAISTYDTDYILVKHKVLAKALAALEAAGHEVRELN